jgi:hypothetical protein
VKGSARTIALLAAAAGAALQRAGAQQAAAPGKPVTAAFVERPDRGLDFRHFRFKTPAKKYLCETAGAGVGLLDYDRDGDLDVYCVQSCPLPGYPGPEPAPPDMLYRNEGGLRFSAAPAEWDTEERAPDGTTKKVKKRLGLGDLRYGMGVTCPDVDNDGWPDLFVTNVGRDALYRNDRDGTFTDVTESAGIVDDLWSAAAGWADLDGDGDLDLYLANYALIDFEKYPVCGNPPKRVAYCHPDMLKSAPDRMWRNDGGFKFTEVTKEAGISEAAQGGKGLAVLPFDVNGDGLLDLFVANDADPNFLWVNQGGMKFEDQAGWLGVAVSGKGASQSCMGTEVADVNGDLRLDLFCTNFVKEGSVLYVRRADEFFDDRSFPSGLGGPSYPYIGFGARFFDFDKDADLDLMVVNGHIVDDVEEVDSTQTFLQVPHFFVNRGEGTFDQVGPSLSPFFTKPNLGRGLAVGDLDDDGDQDVVVLENDHPIVLLENVLSSPNRWIGFALTGTKSPRDAIGATVLLECAGKKQIRPLTATASYLSWNDLRLYFGVGPQDPTKVRASATIRWPSGTVQELKDLALDKYHAVTEPAAR